MRALLPLVALLTLANADEPDIPVEVKAMLDAAMASGNEAEVNTIVKYVRAAKLPATNAIIEIANDWKRERRNRATQRIRQANFFDLIKGRAQVGGFMTTGNTNNVGVSGSLDLTREGLSWRHKLRLRADYQESFGVTSREHYLAAYEPNYKVDDRLYVYGALQYESDRFFGYFNRYSASAGAGYTAIKDSDMTLDLELGPAFRHTDFTDDTMESNLAARGSVDFDWKLSPAVTFRQDAAAYVQSANSTVSSTTALNAKLFGPFSAELSYALQYESMPPVGRENTDTTTRASLVVDF